MSEKPTYEELEAQIQQMEKADLEHIQTQKALRKSEQRYRMVLQDLPVMICSYFSG